MRTKIGALYIIEFLDHVQGDDTAAKSTVVGKLMERDRKKLVIASWWYDAIDYKKQDDFYTIVRSAVTSIKELRVD